LFDFANELQTQLSGMTTPINHLDTLASTPVLLGDFGEASALGASHQAAVAEMSELLGQVQQAVDFAENITKTVATGYQNADSDVAGGMKVAGADTATPTSGSNSQSLWATAYGAAGGHHHAGTGSGGNWDSGGSSNWGNGNWSGTAGQGGGQGGNGGWTATNGNGSGSGIGNGNGIGSGSGSDGGGTWT
jgi:hypothetical protein